MTFLELHIIDWAIIFFYFFLMLYIGTKSASVVKDQEHLFIAGRKLNKVYQFFLIFGELTEANNAVTVTSEVSRQGVGGVWITLQGLFFTPLYWFFAVWFRRVRLITSGDLFLDRFRSKTLAALYAVYGIIITTVFVGMGYVATAKTLQAVMIKPINKYTVQDRQMIEEYKEFRDLDNQYVSGRLPEEELNRYQTLKNMKGQGKLMGYVSYIGNNPLILYLILGFIMGIYIVSGGFHAAALVKIIQGVLIIIISFILIPFGLKAVGGFSGLHAALPAYMFDIFGSVETSEYTWYSVLAITLATLVGIPGGTGSMSGQGAAKDEYTSRLGTTMGGFAKRFMTISWVICGLIVVVLYADKISDPDGTWGLLTRGLLGIGGVGLMITGILAANMSSMDAASVNVSALFVRNLYSPLFPKKSERHYVVMGRYLIAFVLGISIIVAMVSSGIVSLLKIWITLTTMFGAVVYLIFFWRRLTKTAVLVEVILSIIILVILPITIPQFKSIRKSPQFTVQTEERTVTLEREATKNDVSKNLANKVGEAITVTHTTKPKAIFFESVTSVNPLDPDSPLEGKGRFNSEVFLCGLIGIPVETFSNAGIVATRFLFSALFPIIILILLSLLSKPTKKEILDRFYVKMKTPTAPTLEEDAIEIEKSYANPTRFDHLKIFPKSNWEFIKPTKQDVVGFFISCILVIIILFAFKIVLSIGS